MTDDDPFQLQRFVDAQKGTFDVALMELQAGRKQSHWIWFIFPQLAGLGRSPTAQFYGIRSIHEARGYLAHPMLGDRYRQAVEAILAWAGEKSAAEVLGDVDAMKLRSSLTLFENASGDPLFVRALDLLYEGPDEATLRLLDRI
ncbi:MAG TPA: DUF1810 domain-containing protein [Sphingomicrobium sp.]